MLVWMVWVRMRVSGIQMCKPLHNRKEYLHEVMPLRLMNHSHDRIVYWVSTWLRTTEGR